MMWKGKQLTTMHEVFEEAIKCKDQKEAKQFLQTYVKTGVKEEIAKSNLGYFAGYYSPDVREKILQLFNAPHPIFGTTQPTPEEAFRKGVELGKTFGRKH